MLQNSRVTDVTVFELFRENQLGGGGGGVKLSPPPNQIRIKALSNIYDGAFMQKWLTNFSRYLFSQESFIGDVDVSKGSQRHLGKCALHLHVRNTHSNISGEKAAIYLLKVNNRN